MLPSPEGSTSPAQPGQAVSDGARYPGERGEVTRQYLSGELSLRLSDLESVLADPEQRRLAAQLRRDAELIPPGCLGYLVWRGLRLGQEACRLALEEGDWGEFLRRMAVCSSLWEFGVCSSLIDPAEASGA